MAGATQLFGTTSFSWTDGGAQEHTLSVPLQKVRPSVRLRRWVRESIDYSTREVWYAGSGVYEIVAEIRYDDAPQSLVDLLLAGAKDITITYDDGTNTHACKLIDPATEAITPGFDDYQTAEDWHRIEIRLRKTDGSSFNATVFTG